MVLSFRASTPLYSDTRITPTWGKFNDFFITHLICWCKFVYWLSYVVYIKEERAAAFGSRELRDGDDEVKRRSIPAVTLRGEFTVEKGVRSVVMDT